MIFKPGDGFESGLLHPSQIFQERGRPETTKSFHNPYVKIDHFSSLDQLCRNVRNRIENISGLKNNENQVKKWYSAHDAIPIQVDLIKIALQMVPRSTVILLT